MAGEGAAPACACVPEGFRGILQPSFGHREEGVLTIGGATLHSHLRFDDPASHSNCMMSYILAYLFSYMGQ